MSQLAEYHSQRRQDEESEALAAYFLGELRKTAGRLGVSAMLGKLGPMMDEGNSARSLALRYAPSAAAGAGTYLGARQVGQDPAMAAAEGLGVGLIASPQSARKYLRVLKTPNTSEGRTLLEGLEGIHGTPGDPSTLAKVLSKDIAIKALPAATVAGARSVQNLSDTAKNLNQATTNINQVTGEAAKGQLGKNMADLTGNASNAFALAGGTASNLNDLTSTMKTKGTPDILGLQQPLAETSGAVNSLAHSADSAIRLAERGGHQFSEFANRYGKRVGYTAAAVGGVTALAKLIESISHLRKEREEQARNKSVAR